MERERLRKVQGLLRRLGRRRSSRRQRYTDGAIVEVYFWSVICDRPVAWACDPSNWPPGLRRGTLPSQPAMSRRLRTAAVRALIDRIEHLARPPVQRPALVGVMDGKALTFALHSGDAQSGTGRGVGHIARGYKIHAVVDAAGRLLIWRLASLNIDERVMAKRLLRDMPPCAYVVADAHYDSNSLYQIAAQRGMQLVTPRRYGPGKGLGHQAHHPARLRSKALLEENASPFGAELLRHRRTIERVFAWLTGFAGGLVGLPPWVRTYRRVKAWVQSKIILAHLKGPLARADAA
jgi:hypothetical protein